MNLEDMARDLMGVEPLPRIITQKSGERVHILSSHRAVSFGGRGGGSTFRDPPVVARVIQAALLATILWVVEVCTSKVRISGSVSRRCRTVS